METFIDNELISVIVPVFNAEKYIDRCVTSIIKQTYRNLEIILVDDGSMDNSFQLCDDWARKDKRIKVIHKENAGAGLGRNTGLENVTGKAICFFDSDDYVDATLIEKAYEVLKKQNVQLVLYGIKNIDCTGRVSNVYIPYTEKKIFEGDEIQEIFLPELLNPNNRYNRNKNLCFGVWNCLISREILGKFNWRFKSERDVFSEDSYALLELYKRISKLGILNEALYYYCENETSLTHTFKEDRYEKIKNFYYESIKLKTNLKYNDAVADSLAGLFLSFSIGAMKQIIQSDLDVRSKKGRLRRIIDDDLMVRILIDKNIAQEKLKRRILFITMKYKMYNLCYILIKVNQ